MSGKLCFGATAPQNNAGAGRIRTSNAFCEGINYRASGTAVAKPAADNPHESGSDAWNAWDDGWDLANAATGGTLGAQGCCAPTGTISV